MSGFPIENINIKSQKILMPPEQLKNLITMTQQSEKMVVQGRQVVQRILNGEDHRLFLVIGPCSIHDVEAALEYASRLKKLSDEVNDTLYLIMRVYFEKPRTTVGWKGLINDPHLDDSFCIEEGLQIARRLLIDINTLGLPVATEALDPISPQYLQDLIAWSAIGARTTESQTHREMASGLSSPVGFKNGTDGNLEMAINALQSVAKPHTFLGINNSGKVALTSTKGNQDSHIVLRGGKNKPNYDSVNVAMCEQQLLENSLGLNIVIDCSHANSNKDPSLQSLVVQNVTHQIIEGNQSIIGMMIESNLEWGNQPMQANKADLKYGQSITDACIDWETTEQLVRDVHKQLKEVLPKRTRSVK